MGAGLGLVILNGTGFLAAGADAEEADRSPRLMMSGATILGLGNVRLQSAVFRAEIAIATPVQAEAMAAAAVAGATMAVAVAV